MPQCLKCDKLTKTIRRGLCDSCARKSRNRSPLVRCACGCGELIHSISYRGIPIRFKHGHNSRGKNNPMYKNGLRIGKYISVMTTEKHRNGRLKTKYQHRLIMEQHIGRKLTAKEDVHHIDGNKHNNDISNLQLLLKSEHTIITHTIDKSNRLCVLCNKKTRINKNGNEDWYSHEDGFRCYKCYMNEYNIRRHK